MRGHGQGQGEGAPLVAYRPGHRLGWLRGEKQGQFLAPGRHHADLPAPTVPAPLPPLELASEMTQRFSHGYKTVPYNSALIGFPVLAGAVKPSRPRRVAGLIFIAVKSVAVKSSRVTGLDFT